MNEKTIYEKSEYRIIQSADLFTNYEDIKGDLFCPKANPEIDENKLKEEEEEYKERFYREGCYMYHIEKWNPKIGKGWEAYDIGCGGFVGEYCEDDKHYIVDELKMMIDRAIKQNK